MMMRADDPAPVVDVSVVIATVGRPDDLRRCLRGLAKGTMLPAELIVVDQSSDDATVTVLADVGKDLPTILHLRQDRRGMSAAQNLAVQQANQPLIAVTDDDCLPEPDWIERVASNLSHADSVDFVAGRVWPLDTEAERQYPVSSRLSRIPRRFKGRSLPWDVGSGNNFAVTRDWFLRVGGCDERLGPGAVAKGGADMDLFYRLLRAGAVGRYEPTIAVRHARQTRKERLSRRMPYGYGMGACCGFYLREHDWYALVMLAVWFGLRARRTTTAIVRRRWTGVHEQLLMIGGTFRGLSFGLRVQEPSWERISPIRD